MNTFATACVTTVYLVLTSWNPHRRILPSLHWGALPSFSKKKKKNTLSLGCQEVYDDELLTSLLLLHSKPHSEALACTLFIVLHIYWEGRCKTTPHSSIVFLHSHTSACMNMVSWYKMYIVLLNGSRSMLSRLAASSQHHHAGAWTKKHLLP